MNAPRHIAIIMDGNRRWAQQNGVSRAKGWAAGLENVFTMTEAAQARGVKWITYFAFSSENWQRPAQQVLELTSLLDRSLSDRIDELVDKGVGFHPIGDLSMYSQRLRDKLRQAEEKTTASTPSIDINMALSYGGRWDIVQAAQHIARTVQEGAMRPEDIDEAAFEKRVLTVHAGPLDLLIRTGNEHRLSNFLLWQCAYAELFFSQALWPDFSVKDLDAALHEFGQRTRRYGD